MSLRNDLSQSRIALTGFLAIGTGWGGFAAASPALKAHLGLSESQLGMALFCGAVGALCSMALSPRVMRWAGRGRGLIAAIALPMAIGFAMVGQASSLPQLGAALALMGLSTGLMDVLINARVAEAEARTGRHLMSLAHGSFSLIYAVSAFSIGLVREAQVPLPWLYGGLALACLFWCVLSIGDPGSQTPPEPEAQSRKPTALPLAVPLIGLIILAAFFAENATEIWAALHIEQTLGGRAAEGALGPTMLGLTMAVGRFSGQGLASRFGTRAVMRVMALLGASGGMIAALAPSPMVAYIGFGLLGLGISSLAPLAFNLGGRYLTPEALGRGIARMSLIGYMGFFLGPPALGLVSEHLGLRASFVIIALAIASVPLIQRALPALPSKDA